MPTGVFITKKLIRDKILRFMEVTHYYVSQLNQIGIKYWVNPRSMTVFFKVVSIEIKKIGSF